MAVSRQGPRGLGGLTDFERSNHVSAEWTVGWWSLTLNLTFLVHLNNYYDAPDWRKLQSKMVKLSADSRRGVAEFSRAAAQMDERNAGLATST